MSDQCCPKFDPTLWDNKVFEWDNKKFIKDSVRTLFHVPINFGSVMKKLDAQVRQAEAATPEAVCLSDHTSKGNMDVYLAVNKEVAGANNVTLSGKFLCKIYEGNFKDTGKWCKDFENYAKEKNTVMKKMYMWYTTCPKCAKKYGHNYVAIVAQVE